VAKDVFQVSKFQGDTVLTAPFIFNNTGGATRRTWMEMIETTQQAVIETTQQAVIKLGGTTQN